jgi:hypothetical protein
MGASREQFSRVIAPIAAAAFRAAADQEKLGPDRWEGSRPNDYERGWNAALRNISRIAAELEAQ